MHVVLGVERYGTPVVFWTRNVDAEFRNLATVRRRQVQRSRVRLLPARTRYVSMGWWGLRERGLQFTYPRQRALPQP